jgi:hypothetical protein
MLHVRTISYGNCLRTQDVHCRQVGGFRFFSKEFKLNQPIHPTSVRKYFRSQRARKSRIIGRGAYKLCA